MNKTLSIVVSVYNEEEALPSFYKEIKKELNELKINYELIFVNDGSTDRSANIIRSFSNKDTNVKALFFSKNFGHEAAMIAGIDYSNNDIIICMDADLQHPPALLKNIINKFNEGYEIINMVRTSNLDAGILKNITSHLFYNFINSLSDIKLQKNASDFFAISKRAASNLKSNYREKVRFLRGYVQNIGFKKTTIEYQAAKRIAGKSKYSISKLFSFSMNTIMCFSNVPLKLGIYAGFFSIILGIIVAFYTILTWLKVGTPDGYATIIVLICFMFAVLFFIVGIMGEYISILFNEIKSRPIYIIEEKLNIEK